MILYLRNLVLKQSFGVAVDRIYPIDRIVEAYKYVETEQKAGNVVITIPGTGR